MGGAGAVLHRLSKGRLLFEAGHLLTFCLKDGDLLELEAYSIKYSIIQKRAGRAILTAISRACAVHETTPLNLHNDSHDSLSRHSISREAA